MTVYLSVSETEIMDLCKDKTIEGDKKMWITRLRMHHGLSQEKIDTAFSHGLRDTYIKLVTDSGGLTIGSEDYFSWGSTPFLRAVALKDKDMYDYFLDNAVTGDYSLDLVIDYLRDMVADDPSIKKFLKKVGFFDTETGSHWKY